MSTSTPPESVIINPTDSVWDPALTPAGCARCQAVYLVEAEAVGSVCPACARGRLEAQPVRVRPGPPELLIPFKQSTAAAGQALAAYCGAVRFACDGLAPAAVVRTMRAVYWPMWLVDGDVRGPWQAEAGFDYQVKSSQEQYQGGAWQTHEVIETRIRWEPRVGELTRHYDNVAVPALRAHAAWLGWVGAYQPTAAQAYGAGARGPALVRAPDLPPDEAWPQAQVEIARVAGAECQQAAQAQHVRNFALAGEYAALNWTQMLLPLYVTYYTADDGQSYPLYINGQSGQVAGVRLASLRKAWLWAGVIGAVAAALFVMGVVALLAATLFPPLGIVTLFCFVAAFGGGVLAFVPPLWVWQWNRGQNRPPAPA